MVVLLNLNDEQDLLTFHNEHDQSTRFHKPHLRALMTTRNIPRNQANGDAHNRPNPNVNGFSAALACYPSASPPITWTLSHHWLWPLVLYPSSPAPWTSILSMLSLELVASFEWTFSSTVNSWLLIRFTVPMTVRRGTVLNSWSSMKCGLDWIRAGMLDFGDQDVKWRHVREIWLATVDVVARLSVG